MCSMKPKVLFIDIETSPILANVWGLWKQNISLDMIEEDWYIMAYAAKWLGSDTMFYNDTRHTPEDDKYVLKEIWELLNEADFVIAHNGDKFDIKKINARFILNGFEPPAPYKTIDTLKMARRTFAFTSNKLAYLTDKLCEDKKLNHGKYAGYLLWRECLGGNMDAWAEMRKYNEMDVISLEELYLVLRPWHPAHPVFSVFNENKETVICPKCGSDHLQKRGFSHTNAGKYQRYQCTSCGGWSRSRYSELTKKDNEKSPVSC